MKLGLNIILWVSLTALFVSCGGPQGNKAGTNEAADVSATANATIYTINTGNSMLEWEGSKPTGTHMGTINLKSGSIGVAGDKIVSGSFVFDMKSIKNTDLTDAEYNKKLVGHLMSSDFFAVDSFPEAHFTITSVDAIENPQPSDKEANLTHLIKGNLKIKSTEKNITFKASIMIENNQIVAAAPQFLIDRSEWKIKYASRKFFDNLKDKFVNDEIGIKFNILAIKEI